MSKHKTFGGEIEVDDGIEDDAPDLVLERYADYVDSLTPEQFREHWRGINAARRFEELERERLI
jgi:hypothetical protein